jgi:16S rRNA processing protein RimM
MARKSDGTVNPDFICLGLIGAARGLKGEVRVTSYTGDPTALGSYGPLSTADGSRSFTVQVVGRAKNQVIAKIAGVTDRDGAEALRGIALYLPRDALPKAADDEFYLADLIGLAVETVDGESLGRVTAVDDFGAGPIVEVDGGARGAVMLPFSDAVVPTVDLESRRMIVDPPAGLLDGASENEGREDQERSGEGE